MKNHNRRANFSTRLFVFAVLVTILNACSSTERYLQNSELTITGSTVTNQQALNKFFHKADEGYKIDICEADTQTNECLEDGKGVIAQGFGGIFLPLFMEMYGLDIIQSNLDGDIILVRSKIDADINKIAPWCGTVSGRLTTENAVATLSFSNFYCNWAVIGNVITNIDMSINNLNVTEETFSGYYRITFYGTGNASGSGYYKAALLRN